MKHVLLKILLFLFLGTSYLSATHIHFNDLEHEEECEICVVIHHFQSADIPHPTVEMPLVEYSYDEILFHQSVMFEHLPTGFHSTAPPVF